MVVTVTVVATVEAARVAAKAEVAHLPLKRKAQQRQEQASQHAIVWQARARYATKAGVRRGRVVMRDGAAEVCWKRAGPAFSLAYS